VVYHPANRSIGISNTWSQHRHKHRRDHEKRCRRGHTTRSSPQRVNGWPMRPVVTALSEAAQLWRADGLAERTTLGHWLPAFPPCVAYQVGGQIRGGQ
jgi:hypothetical protein